MSTTVLAQDQSEVKQDPAALSKYISRLEARIASLEAKAPRQPLTKEQREANEENLKVICRRFNKKVGSVTIETATNVVTSVQCK